MYGDIKYSSWARGGRRVQQTSEECCTFSTTKSKTIKLCQEIFSNTI